jgi:polar amino acid transport system substrate-binding protein
VLLDNVLAERRHRAIAGFAVQPATVAVGHYVGVLAPAEAPLRDAINEILRRAMRDGSLERILRTWHVWNDDQPKLYARLVAGKPVAPVTGLDGVAQVSGMTGWAAAGRYLPSLLRASVVTIVLSCLSMGLAVIVGVSIATGRVYGPRVLRAALVGYVELMRGTPILLQLFVLYYGLAAAIRLPAFAAALLGLALNYAAYESEIYRAALEAVPAGQLEAARAFGMGAGQVFSRILLPQMIRHALPGFGNNWLVLLKATALLSIIGLNDMVFRADQAGGSTHRPFTFLFAVALIYLALTTVSVLTLRWAERRADRPYRQVPA